DSPPSRLRRATSPPIDGGEERRCAWRRRFLSPFEGGEVAREARRSGGFLRYRRPLWKGGSSYFGSASENSTARPCAGVTISPSHITRLPRITVPTGQPVTCLPS